MIPLTGAQRERLKHAASEELRAVEDLVAELIAAGVVRAFDAASARCGPHAVRMCLYCHPRHEILLEFAR